MGSERTEIRVTRGLWENHTHGPWIAEIERDGMRHAARGHTEDEARERLLDTLRRMR